MKPAKIVVWLVVGMLIAPHISPVKAQEPHAKKVNMSAGHVKKKGKIFTSADYWKPLDRWLKKQGSPLSGRDFYEVGKKYGVDPDLLIGIAQAETNLGRVRQRNSAFNIGSVCSYDSTSTTCHARSYRHGIEQIAQTLTNNALRTHVSVSQLSGFGNPHGPYYASSPWNWHHNVITTMNRLKGKHKRNYPIHKRVGP